jgi:hypothetical protein
MDDHEVKIRINMFQRYEDLPQLPDGCVLSFLAHKLEDTKPSNFLNNIVRSNPWIKVNERKFFILLYTALTAPAIIEEKTPNEIVSEFTNELYHRSQYIIKEFEANHPNDQGEWQRVHDDCYFGSFNFGREYSSLVRHAATANDGTLADVIIQGRRQHEDLLFTIIENAEKRIGVLPTEKNWLLEIFGKPGKPGHFGGKKRATTRRRKKKMRRSRKQTSK